MLTIRKSISITTCFSISTNFLLLPSTCLLLTMNASQDPSKCTEDAIYKKRKFAPRQIGLPMLLHKMVKTDLNSWNKYVNEQKDLYGKCDDMKVVAEKDETLAKACAKVICPRPISKLSRSLATSCNWQLAPNRYNIKGRDIADIVQRQTGKKGPFYSGTLRNDDSLYGHIKLPKPCGSDKFYDIPSMADLLNRYHNKHKMRFLTASRYSKPYLRFMVKDLVLCWRDPDEPAPNAYFPSDPCELNPRAEGCKEKASRKIAKSKPAPIVNFLPNSSVPARDTAFLKVFDKSIPGPGRYETIEIACPCQSKLIVEPTIWYTIEVEKRKRFRRLKHRQITEELYCPCSKVRNIIGHGHTSNFRSKTVRLIEKPPPTKKSDRVEKMHHTVKYIQMIVNPSRVPISFPRFDMTPKKTDLKFNSIVKSKTRRKLKVNKRIAFLSGMPRFKGDEIAPPAPPLIDKAKSHLDRGRGTIAVSRPFGSKDEPKHPTLTESTHDIIFNRLQQLPMRFRQKQIAAREKIFTFSPLPTAQLLLKDSDILKRDPEASYFNISSKIEDFLKDEYKKSANGTQLGSESENGDV